MTTISPTRVSMYDFLYHDTKPMVSLLADAAQLSLPQSRLAIDASLQVIVSALLAYQQRHHGQAVNKKLFCRSAIKELRKYNSMNFATIDATLYHRNDAADAIFNDNAKIIKASEHIAAHAHATVQQVQVLLTSLCAIALRELAILADYSQMDNEEIDKWFSLQPQFLSADRFSATNAQSSPENLVGDDISTDNTIKLQPEHPAERHLLSAEQLSETPPPFDPYWYKLTNFESENIEPVEDMQFATGNYLKAIGRSPDNLQQGQHDDMLVFAELQAIAVPHQRWLLQLAKISDIYLSRDRLRITSEPASPPKPPFVNLSLLGGHKDNTSTTVNDKQIEPDAPTPLCKNPVILIIILVIGTLGALATLKYQSKEANGAVLATEEVEQSRLESHS